MSNTFTTKACSKLITLFALVFCLLVLSGCASTSKPAELEDPELRSEQFSEEFNFLDSYDPLEPLNRQVYKFNAKFDEYIFLPVLRTYKAVTPRFVRSGVSNFFANLGEIPVLLNSALQIKPESTLVTTGRLLINTTIGIGGLWDPASKLGLKRRNEDLGQTLGYYGIASGPYLVLPILGPSSLRDTTGDISDRLIQSDINFVGLEEALNEEPLLFGLEAVNQRHINPFRYGQFNSPFEYDLIRYFYLKQREFLINQ